jgi:hypothetical protein
MIDRRDHFGELFPKMTQDDICEETLTLEEFDELLAKATDSTPEEIRRGAEEIDLGPPWKAEIVDE